MLRDSSEPLQFPTRVRDASTLRLWFEAGVVSVTCPLGLGLTKANGCEKCEGVSACKHTSRRPHARRSRRLCMPAPYSTYLNSRISFGVKKDLKLTIKCFEEIKSTKTYFFLSFFPLHRQCPLFNP